MNFDFNLLKEEIQHLYNVEAMHRKGFKMSEATVDLAAANAIEEWGEFMVERVKNTSQTAQMEELADVLAATLHCIYMMGSPQHLQTIAIRKLRERFIATRPPGNYDTTDFPTKPCRNCGRTDRPQFKGICNIDCEALEGK